MSYVPDPPPPLTLRGDRVWEPSLTRPWVRIDPELVNAVGRASHCTRAVVVEVIAGGEHSRWAVRPSQDGRVRMRNTSRA